MEGYGRVTDERRAPARGRCRSRSAGTARRGSARSRAHDLGLCAPGRRSQRSTSCSAISRRARAPRREASASARALAATGRAPPRARAGRRAGASRRARAGAGRRRARVLEPAEDSPRSFGVSPSRTAARTSPPRRRRRRRAARSAPGAAARRGTARPGRGTSSQRSSASRELRVLVGGREAGAEVGARGAAEHVEPRCLARRLRRRDRQHRTDPDTAASRAARRAPGPAAIGPRSRGGARVTASAISPGASGGSVVPRRRASARARARAGGRARGRSAAGAGRFASGQCAASSPVAAARTRSPVSELDRRGRPRARRAARRRRRVPSPKSDCSSSAYATSKASSSQSKPPQPRRSRSGAEQDGAEERLVLARAAPAWARAKIRAAGSRRRSSSAMRASPRSRAARPAPRRSARTSGRYSYSAGRPASRAPRRRTAGRLRPRARASRARTRRARSRAASGRGAERARPRLRLRVEQGFDTPFAISSYSHEIVSPRDAASGQATGKRQHKPLTIRKEIDKSTPLLMRAIFTNQTLPAVQMTLNGRDGKAVATVKLTNASVADHAAERRHGVDQRSRTRRSRGRGSTAASPPRTTGRRRSASGRCALSAMAGDCPRPWPSRTRRRRPRVDFLRPRRRVVHHEGGLRRAARDRWPACPPPRVREEATPMSFRVLAFQLAIFAAAVVGPGSITGWKW